MSNAYPPPPLGPDFTTSIFNRISVDRYTSAESALGPVYLGWTVRGVSALRRADSPAAEAAFTRWYQDRTGRRIVRAVEVDAIARAAQLKLRDDAADDVPLDLAAATSFEREVLGNVALIRSGHARPYQLLARELGESCAAQSVADVLSNNAVPLLIPCHRVVPEDRCCSAQYVFGVDAQQQLLAAEGLDANAVDRAIASGIRYIESDGWFCLPTCGDVASRVGSPGYVGLHSLAEAHARGLRACESCRPVAA